MNEGEVRKPGYTIIVSGDIESNLAPLFNGLHMETIPNATVLTGRVRDQAELHAYLQSLSELGLELISVQQVL